METIQIAVSVVLLKEESRWVAQCLEYDVAGQGQTIRDAVYDMERMLVGQVFLNVAAKKQSFEDLAPAPECYWRMFGNAEPLERNDATPFRALPRPRV